MLRSPTGLLVLHGLRLKGLLNVEALADFLTLECDEVQRGLDLAADAGQARFRDGAVRSWSLTAEGRKENERLLAEQVDQAGRRSDVQSAYRRFLDLNPSMLATCTRWQVKDQQNQLLNDHQDLAYDRKVVAELAKIHAAVKPICAELGTWFDRFGSYGPRFEAAMNHLHDGNGDWFTKPTIDSYHTVWFELHEDLLATLGLDRVSEQATEPSR